MSRRNAQIVVFFWRNKVHFRLQYCSVMNDSERWPL